MRRGSRPPSECDRASSVPLHRESTRSASPMCFDATHAPCRPAIFYNAPKSGINFAFSLCAHGHSAPQSSGRLPVAPPNPGQPADASTTACVVARRAARVARCSDRPTYGRAKRVSNRHFLRANYYVEGHIASARRFSKRAEADFRAICACGLVARTVQIVGSCHRPSPDLAESDRVVGR